MHNSLFTDDDPVRLIGGRHRESGRIVFPCPADAAYEAVPLGRKGQLWSYTVQRFRPKSPPYAGPEAFEPWAIAYVELPGEVIVEAWLTDVAFEDIHIGMELELSPQPLGGNSSLIVPAFAPVKALAA
ncbi:DNA-binding protein [Novosphingobium umbonatum]|uniref:DNA-binding protein n=1 Tax=Novosphingobium umbonatum TaxID=1908524 RepID=A0A3S2USN2_9SPHN|nr:OB-fold domain-containing protein [Novosphingobium umbonatum]RVU05939.1 DNA-binding protein [Novosphingobium umbonatum]